MKNVSKKENKENTNDKDKTNKENELTKINLNKMEDDLKNLINEKDDIIKNMNDKLLKQENIIKDQSEKIEQLFQIINNLNALNNKLNESINFDIEISGTDKEIKDLKGIGLDLEMFDENSFDNYFKTENQLEPDKFIFSIRQRRNDKIPIKELVSQLEYKFF